LCLLVVSGAFAQVPDFTTDQQIKLYQEWVAQDASAPNRVLLASAYVQKTRETTDFTYLERATKALEGVESSDAARLRNIVALTMHRFRSAADGARALVAKNPNDVQSWGTLGDAALEMGRYQDARDAFATMLNLKPGLASYNRMGFYRFLTGDVEGGIGMMQEAVKSSAKHPENLAWCLTELGHMYRKVGHQGAAADAYRDAIAAFPTAHAAFAGLAAVDVELGKLDEAIEFYKKAQAITPMVQYAGELYSLYTQRGDQKAARVQAALIDAQDQLEMASGQSANRTLALILADQNRKLDRALELATADLALRQDVYTHDAMAWVLFKLGRIDEARLESQKALALGSPEPIFRKHAEAIAAATRVVSRD
jgi:tetratricopeptide (TPR) repeat protein